MTTYIPEEIEPSVAMLNSSTTVAMLSNPTEGPTDLMLAMNEYGKVHGPLALTVCIFGIILNIISIAVLSDKEMVSSVNRLLQAIGK